MKRVKKYYWQSLETERARALSDEHAAVDGAEAAHGTAYYDLYRFRAPRPNTFTIPVKLSGYDKAPRSCTFVKRVDETYATSYICDDEIYLVRYRTGNKLHEKRPYLWLNPETFIPEVLDLKINTYCRYGNHRSIETPVSWK